MKRTNTEMQKSHTILVFLFLFVSVMFFAFLAILLPQFVFLTPLGLVVGPTAVLLKPTLIHGRKWKR